MQLKSLIRHYPRLHGLIQYVRDKGLQIQGVRSGSFSQHGEDKIILELLRDAGANGPFVDIGCNHPFKYNNTYLLQRQGRSGICIDPLPRFRRSYARWRPHDHFVCVAVGEVEGEMPFYEFEWDMLSTLDAKLAAAYQSAGHRLLRESVVRVRPINSVLAELQAKPPLSLISLDIEGYELNALRTIDLDYWRPEFICLEVQTAVGSSDSDAADYLKAHGYTTVRNLGLNVILQRGIGDVSQGLPR